MSALATLPRLALSIRQPWCWATVHAGKRLENRNWYNDNADLDVRGPICLRAGTNMTQEEYHQGAAFMASLGITCPPAAELQRGGIIGTARVIGVTAKSEDPWFVGRIALVLDQVKPVEFIGCVGDTGFFPWAPNGLDPQPPGRWMLAKSAPVAEQQATPQLPLI